MTLLSVEYRIHKVQVKRAHEHIVVLNEKIASSGILTYKEWMQFNVSKDIIEGITQEDIERFYAGEWNG